jgi:hypothetical protein
LWAQRKVTRRSARHVQLRKVFLFIGNKEASADRLLTLAEFSLSNPLRLRLNQPKQRLFRVKFRLSERPSMQGGGSKIRVRLVAVDSSVTVAFVVEADLLHIATFCDMRFS